MATVAEMYDGAIFKHENGFWYMSIHTPFDTLEQGSRCCVKLDNMFPKLLAFSGKAELRSSASAVVNRLEGIMP